MPAASGDQFAQISPRQRERHKETLRVGLQLAADAGIPAPTTRSAVWELLIEAADTLKRLPDRERRWLRSGTHAAWPDTLREYSEEFAVAVARGGKWEAMSPGLSPPTSEAIARLDIVMEWLRHAANGRSSRPDARIVFALAAGVPVRVVRRRFGIARRTIYDIRDRGIDRICVWLNTSIE